MNTVERRWASGLVALGTIVRLLPLALPFDFSGPDSASYLGPAHGLLEQGCYCMGGEPTALRPPGYPVFLAAVLGLSGQSLLAVRAAQALLGGLAAAGIYLVLARTTRWPRCALLGGLLAALDPVSIGQSPWLLREGLLLGLLVGLVAALTLLRGRARYAVGGLLLGALTLTHQLYLLLGGFLFLADALARRPRHRLLPWVGMGLIVLLVAFLWARRTERVTGHLSLAATENAVPARELWLTTACSNWWLSGDERTGFQAQAWAEERELVTTRGVQGAKAEYYRRFFANWREHPLRSFARTLRLNLWYWLEIPGAIRLVKDQRLAWVRWLILPFHWARLAAALAGLLYLLRSGGWRAQRATLACLAFLGLAPALLYPVPRYLGPGVPLLDLLAAIGLSASWARRRERTA
ncbi:MAG: glycosyltransferase family 39 protein [Planctomycetota bacterium]